MEQKMAEAAQYPTRSDTFVKSYIKLRTILDSLEVHALRYVLNEKKDGDRVDRAKEVGALLLPILQHLGGVPDLEGECPEGYVNCGGCCVPYQCPEMSEF